MRQPVLLSADHAGETMKKCAVATDYIKVTLKAGLMPYISPLDFEEADYQELAEISCDHVSGVVLTGGADVNPSYFGEPLHEKIGEIDKFRDRFEIALAKEAIKRDLPILGICRGSQIINVALGGSLYQDIPSQIPNCIEHNVNENRHIPLHQVEVVDKESLLFKITKSDTLGVNSVHHQSVKDLGNGLRISAVAPDGVVEAVEMPGYIFLLGVQWHPENMVAGDPKMMSIFHSFAEAVRGRGK